MPARADQPEKLEVSGSEYAYTQTIEFVYLGACITGTPNLTAEVNRHCQLGW